ncbi:MAG: hypothetical protein Kow00108_22810 [Calditrichia bacterium]
MKAKSFVIVLLAVFWVTAQTLPPLILGEYYIDSDPGVGNGIPLQVADNNWDEMFESIISEQSAQLTEGSHLIGIRLYSGGQWSTTYRVPFFINSATEKIPHLISGEYYIDTDPGTGNGIPLIVADNAWDQLFESIMNESSAELSEGAHRIGVRIYTTNQWSSTYIIPFNYHSANETVPHLIFGEYFINIDPGAGNGIPLIAGDNTWDQLFENIIHESAVELNDGAHRIGVRLYANGQWSFPYIIPFLNNSGNVFVPHIIRGEYYINADPGEGAGYPFIATDGAFDQPFESFTADHPLSQLETKSYTLYARFFMNNHWTGPFGMVFTIPDTTLPVPPREFTATGRNNRIELSWKKNPELDLEGYILYKDSDSTNVLTITDSLVVLGGEDTTYIDSTVVNGTTKYYAIVAVDTNGNKSTPRIVAGATALNSAPYFSVRFEDVMMEEDAQPTKIGPLSQMVIDIDGDNLHYMVSNPDTSWLSVLVEKDSLIIRVDQDSLGNVPVIFTASDNEFSVSDTFMVTVTPVNDLPVFSELPDTVQLNSGEILRLFLPDYISDVEDPFDSLAFTFDYNPNEITVSFDPLKDTVEISVVSQTYGSTWLKIRVDDRDQGTATDSIYFVLNSILSVEDAQNSIPKTVELMQNYPNPFNPTTTIRFGLPKADHVTLELYNISGQRVAVLMKEQRKAGYHSVTFDFSDFATGLYFYSLRTSERTLVKKMLLIK